MPAAQSIQAQSNSNKAYAQNAMRASAIGVNITPQMTPEQIQATMQKGESAFSERQAAAFEQKEQSRKTEAQYAIQNYERMTG